MEAKGSRPSLSYSSRSEESSRMFSKRNSEVSMKGERKELGHDRDHDSWAGHESSDANGSYKGAFPAGEKTGGQNEEMVRDDPDEKNLEGNESETNNDVFNLVPEYSNTRITRTTSSSQPSTPSNTLGGRTLSKVRRLRLPSIAKKGSNKETANSDDGLEQYLPKEEVQLKWQEFEKLCGGDEWKLRTVVLGSRGLYLANVGDDKITDSIPLHEILAVVSEKDRDNFFRRSSLSAAAPSDKAKEADPSSKGKISPVTSFNELKASFSGSNSVKKQKESVTDRSKAPKKGKRKSFSFDSKQDALDGFAGIAAPQTSSEWYNFAVYTQSDGHNSGRTYFFRTHDPDSREDWVKCLLEQSRTAKRKHDNHSRLRRLQGQLRKYYNTAWTQGFVAFLILANFVSSAAESQLNPTPEEASYNYFQMIDLAFTTVFAIEVTVNIVAHGRSFANDGWNWFDLSVVFVSVVSWLVSDLTSIKTLRLLRAFRIIRVVKRLSSLRRLIHAITASIVPVINAMIIVVLVICIYAVMGVNIFQESNPDMFGTFVKALFTMFQTSTLDGWNVAARGMFDEDTGDLDIGVVIFYVSFIVAVSWTLLPVVVAVLLEAFTMATRKEKEMKEALRFHSSKGPSDGHPLDPLLAVLFHADDDHEFQRRAVQLFEVLDADNSGKLTFRELTEGLKKIPKFRKIHISPEDWERMAVERGLTDEDKALSPPQFEKMMRIEVRSYLYRQLGVATAISDTEDPSMSMALSAMKNTLIGIDYLLHQAFPQPEESVSSVCLRRQRSRTGSSSSLRTQSDNIGRIPLPRFPKPSLPPSQGPTREDFTKLAQAMDSISLRLTALEEQNKMVIQNQTRLEKRLCPKVEQESEQTDSREIDMTDKELKVPRENGVAHQEHTALERRSEKDAAVAMKAVEPVCEATAVRDFARMRLRPDGGEEPSVIDTGIPELTTTGFA